MLCESRFCNLDFRVAGAKIDSSTPAKHDKGDKSGKARGFLKQQSREFESNEPVWQMNTNDDNGITTGSLAASSNGKSDG
jgi:hypothetical protein